MTPGFTELAIKAVNTDGQFIPVSCKRPTGFVRCGLGEHRDLHDLVTYDLWVESGRGSYA
jgi:hypothetical protein